MTHRRYRAPRSKQQKDAIKARFFSGPRRCEHCRQEVPRADGDYRTVAGRVVWMCLRHEAGGQ